MPRSSRHLARRCAVQALYQWALTGQNKQDIERSFIKNNQLKPYHGEYFKTMVKNIPENIEVIDAAIRPHLDRQMEEVDLIEHAILRVACYELIYEKTMPVNVVLDEAIELAKTFSAENSHKYINGVLDKVVKGIHNHST